MPKYLAHAKTWLSHECRTVQEGEEFTTTFPLVNGEPMKLGPNIELLDEAKPSAADFAKLNKPQLLEAAKAANIANAESLNKEQLVAALVAAGSDDLA